MEDTSVGLAQVSQDQEVRSTDRGHLVELITVFQLGNMSLQQLWDMAYRAGYEDGMSFISKE